MRFKKFLKQCDVVSLEERSNKGSLFFLNRRYYIMGVPDTSPIVSR